MADIKKRRRQADYLDIGTKTTPKPTFMGSGFTQLNEEPGAQVSSKRYINDASVTRRITGYEPTNPFTSDYILSEPVIEFIAAIAKQRKTGADAETDYIRVDLDDPIAGEVANLYAARKVRVAIEVSSFSDEDGDYQVEGNLDEIGDVIDGTFNTSTRVFTATATVE
jgi:hypothetical protein